MDPVAGAVVIMGLKTVGPAAADVVKDFLGRVLGPVGDATGKALAYPLEEFQRRRIERANDVVVKAARKLSAHNVEPSPVPDRILLPLLQAASLEDEDSLRSLWSNLLAAAADPRTGARIPNSFVSILGELSPTEALVLQLVYFDSLDQKTRLVYPDDVAARFNPPQLFHVSEDTGDRVAIQMPFNNFRVLADNLARLGLVELHFTDVLYGPTDGSKYDKPLVLTPLGHHLLMTVTTYPHPLP